MRLIVNCFGKNHVVVYILGEIKDMGIKLYVEGQGIVRYVKEGVGHEFVRFV